MGIARPMVKMLMREGRREKYVGNALTIGRQYAWVKTQDLSKWSKEMNFQLNTKIETSLLNKKHEKSNNVTDTVLFLSMGFDSLDSLDCSDYEKCTVMHDLNTDVPAKLYNKYDLIFDGGSSEHIFNLPKVLENYHKMLKVGGRIIHALPSSNHVDHGFYMFSPGLFWDYYSANNWEIKDSLFYRHSKKQDKEPWDIYSYTPGCLDLFSYGGLNKGLYGVFFVVKKTNKSTYNAPVQQLHFLKTWKNEPNTKTKESKIENSLKKKITAMLPEKLKSILRPLYLKIPLSFSLKFIGRY